MPGVSPLLLPCIAGWQHSTFGLTAFVLPDPPGGITGSVWTFSSQGGCSITRMKTSSFRNHPASRGVSFLLPLPSLSGNVLLPNGFHLWRGDFPHSWERKLPSGFLHFVMTRKIKNVTMQRNHEDVPLNLYHNIVIINFNGKDMNKVILTMVAVSLVMLGSVPLAMASGGSNSTMTVKDFGGYTVSYNSSTGVIGNLNYSTDQSNAQLSNGIYANGSAPTSAMQMSDVTTIGNGSISLFGVDQPAGFGVVTYSTSLNSSNISVHSTASISLLKANVSLMNQMNGTSSSLMFGIYSSIQINVDVYSVRTANFTGVLLVDGHSSLNSTTGIVTSKMGTTTVGVYPLFALYLTSGNIADKVMEYEKNRERFSYNSTTQLVYGNYTYFHFNSTTGMTGLYSNVSGNELISSMSVTGNGSIGTGNQVPDFYMNTPIIKGSLFLYASQNYVLAVHNNPAVQTAMAIDNSTATITLPQGSNITKFSPGNQSTSISFGTSERANSSSIATNFTVQEDNLLQMDHIIGAGSTNLIISRNNFTEMMIIHGGIVNVSGLTITVSSKNLSFIHIVAPPGMEHEQAMIQNAIMNGKISDQIFLNGQNTLSNMTLEFNSTVSVNVTSQSSGHASIRVGSNGGIHRGTDIVIFLSNQFLNGASKFTISFDNKSVSVSTSSQILNVTSTTSAAYAVFQGSAGVYVVFHIPHFSNHTISISATPSSSYPSLPISNADLIPLAGIVGVIILVAGAIAVSRRNKSKGGKE